MKINIKELLAGLSKINNINSQYVKMLVENNTVKLKAFNNYIKIEYLVKNINSKEKFSIIFNPRILINVLSKINTDQINLEKDTNSLLVFANNFKLALNGLNTEDFLDFNLESKITTQKSILNIEDLQKISKYVQPYALEEQNDISRKLVNINCINITVLNKQLKAFATDMKRLVSLELRNDVKENFNILIYTKTFSQMLKNLSNDKKTEILFNDKNLFFKDEFMIMEVSLISLNYPNIQKTAIDDKKNIFTVNTFDLISKLEMGNILSTNGNNALVYFSFQNDKILLSFKNSEQGYASELIDFKHIKGDIPNFSISINFLMTALKNVVDKSVTFSINDNLSPLFIYDEKNVTLLQVVLPTKNIF